MNRDKNVYSWEIFGLVGDGRGGVFFNSEMSFTDKESGLEVLSWDGYDEDDNFDDFGSEFYTCTVKGTKDQLKVFMENHFPYHLSSRFPYQKGITIDQLNI